MDPHRPLKQGFGIFEAVLLGILVLSIYALAIRGRAKDRPQAQPREEVSSGDPLDTPPPEAVAPEPPPEPEPEPEPEAAEPEVDPDVPPTTDLDQQAVGAVIMDALPAINKCGRRHPAHGLVDTRFTIERNGRVSRVEIVEAPDEELASCVAKQLKKLRFPASEGRTTVSYPFAFEND